MGARAPWHPPIVPLWRHWFRNLGALFLAIEEQAAQGAVVRLHGRGEIDIARNGSRWLAWENGAVIGTFSSIGEAVLAADQHAEMDDSFGGAA